MALGISMVAFTENPTFSVLDIQQQFENQWKDMPQSINAEEKGNTFSFQVGSTDIIIGLMPAPIPWDDIEGPCATSILWPDAAIHLKQHKVHAIVTVSGELEPIPLSRILTKATASLMSASPLALGVYWGNSSLVIPKGIFCDFATKILPLGPPLYIWVDFRVGTNKNRSSTGFTQGMAALGHMEIEVPESPETLAKLRERLLELTGYLIDNGPIINDGDSLGEDANALMRAVYSDSIFGFKEQVIRIVYEQTKPTKAWWKLR